MNRPIGRPRKGPSAPIIAQTVLDRISAKDLEILRTVRFESIPLSSVEPDEVENHLWLMHFRLLGTEIDGKDRISFVRTTSTIEALRLLERKTP